jgi:hypothetical protein
VKTRVFAGFFALHEPLFPERSDGRLQQAATYKDLKRANFRLIEQELYHYKLRKAELEELKLNVIEGTEKPEIQAFSGPGDPTGNKAVKLCSSGVILELERGSKPLNGHWT